MCTVCGCGTDPVIDDGTEKGVAGHKHDHHHHGQHRHSHSHSHGPVSYTHLTLPTNSRV